MKGRFLLKTFQNQMKTLSIYLLINILLSFVSQSRERVEFESKIPQVKTFPKQDSLIYKEDYISFEFDFPVGNVINADGYYNAQEFGENEHLGDDWNSIEGGDSDLGEPIYAIADGYVNFAEDYQGAWGNVIKITHQLPNTKQVESLYAHCDTLLVEPNQWVRKGEQIATIGNVDGLYSAHLHLELRDTLRLGIGGGYSAYTDGYLDPTKFIESH